MTVSQHDSTQVALLREQWAIRVGGLIDQIAAWAEAEGWAVTRGSKTYADRFGATYQLPTAAIKLPGGELELEPTGVHAGIEGRVILEAYPTLSRVRLAGRGSEWEVITESNVPLRAPWDARTFVQLAHDLIA